MPRYRGYRGIGDEAPPASGGSYTSEAAEGPHTSSMPEWQSESWTDRLRTAIKELVSYTSSAREQMEFAAEFAASAPAGTSSSGAGSGGSGVGGGGIVLPEEVEEIKYSLSFLVDKVKSLFAEKGVEPPVELSGLSSIVNTMDEALVVDHGVNENGELTGGMIGISAGQFLPLFDWTQNALTSFMTALRAPSVQETGGTDESGTNENGGAKEEKKESKWMWAWWLLGGVTAVGGGWAAYNKWIKPA